MSFDNVVGHTNYTEHVCQICTVSFNIGRIHTNNEPEFQSRDYKGSRIFEQDLSNSLCSLYPGDSGCKNIKVEGADGVLQHIAGTGCIVEAGYSGHRITFDDIKGMNRAKYIVRKPRNETPNPGSGKHVEAGDEFQEEQVYEKTSKWFITSQTTRPPLGVQKTLEHDRFGIKGHFFEAKNCPVLFHARQAPDPESSNHAGIPVHDACWRIFEKISLERLGRVDIDGFVALWNREACENCGFQNMKHDPVIGLCRKKWWSHRPGTEYLAANPLRIPGFDMMMRGIYSEQSPDGDGVFADKFFLRMRRESRQLDMATPQSDPFYIMPSEIKNTILAQLCSKAIASLRLASRCFQQLPKALFRSLVKHEFPWFWEIDDLKIQQEEYLSKAVEDELAADMLDVDGIDPRFLAFVQARRARTHLDTNWLRIYEQLKILEKGVLGVRNRARIWNIAEEIVGRIENMTARVAFPGAVAGVDFPIWLSKKEESPGHCKCIPLEEDFGCGYFD